MVLAAKERLFEVPEQFHKAKRALMLFCTFSALLAAAHITTPLLNIAIFGDKVQISHWLVALSLWIYCAYLFVNYWRELDYVKTVFDSDLIRATLKSAEDQIQNLGSEYQGLLEMIAESRRIEAGIPRAAKNLQEVHESCRSNWNDEYPSRSSELLHLRALLDEFVEGLAMDPAEDNANGAYLTELSEKIEAYCLKRTEFETEVDRRTVSMMTSMLENFPENSERSSTLPTLESQIMALLRSIERRYGKMSEEIPERDTRYFRWLDVVAPCAMFALATIAPLVDFFGPPLACNGLRAAEERFSGTATHQSAKRFLALSTSLAPRC